MLLWKSYAAKRSSGGFCHYWLRDRAVGDSPVTALRVFRQSAARWNVHCGISLLAISADCMLIKRTDCCEMVICPPVEYFFSKCTEHSYFVRLKCKLLFIRVIGIQPPSLFQHSLDVSCARSACVLPILLVLLLHNWTNAVISANNEQVYQKFCQCAKW